MDLKCITLRSKPKAACSQGLLSLPAELRIRIYTYALVEIPKWQRRHKAMCHLAPRSTKILERPPFIGGDGSFSTEEDRCGCALRDGLSLLAVNRQIHYEAVEIFWSQNTFLFAPACQFPEDVGRKLRPEYRRMLQHVCILNDMLGADKTFYHGYASANNESVFWTLLKCTGLRTIELGHKVLPNRVDVFSEINSLPRLLSLSLAVVLSYEVKAKGVTKFELIPHMSGHKKLPKKSMLWFKTGKEINPITVKSDEDLKECVRSFETNFLVHLQHEINHIPNRWITESGGARKNENCTRAVRRQRRQHSVINPPSPWTMFVSSPTTPAEMAAISRYFVLQDGPATRELTLRDQSDCAIEIMGLPLSGATHVRHARERTMKIQALHAAGQLTVQEEINRQQIENRRAEKRQAQLTAMEATTQERRARRAEQIEEQRRVAKEVRRNEREARVKIQLAAQDLRRVERKRLHSSSPVTTGEKVDHQNSSSVSRPKNRDATPRPSEKHSSKQSQKAYKK